MDPFPTNLAAIRWDSNGVPYSVVFNDHYFCKDNGYEEAVHVSCRGNGLQDRFQGLDPKRKGVFTIIETGFGTGLNFCCAWELWDRFAPASWSLRFISIEMYPIETGHLSQALSLWPQLITYRDALVSQYQPPFVKTRHFHFQEGRVHLTILFDHVVVALAAIKDEKMADPGADAWFLSGFAPFKNPEMWSEQVFDGMAALSCCGSTLATFTVAGHVRRGLEQRGFMVERSPGYGKKKTILRGVFL